MRLLIILCFLGCAPLAAEFQLTILHTNDVHGRVWEFDANDQTCSSTQSQENSCFGGVARRATKINEIRSQKHNVLLLDGGDQFLGTLFYTKYRGKESSIL